MAPFLFPSLVRLSRPQGNAGLGAQPYSGLSQAKETTVITSAKAHIQPDRQGQASLAGLPADAAGQPTVKIILRLPKGVVQRRDVLTDDLGNRYQAIQSTWTPLGTTVLAVTLNGLGAPAAPFPDAPWEQTAGNWEALATPWAASDGFETLFSPWESNTTPWAPASGWDTFAPNWDTPTANWETIQ